MARRGARGAGGGRALTARGPRAGGETPLHVAAGNGRVEVAEKLLAAGAAVGATDIVRGPRAGEGVAGGVCQHRFRAGSVLVSPFSLGGGRGRERGPGARDGSSRGAGRAGGRALTARGPRAGGATPLHWAARNGRVEVAEKLLAAGAAVGAKDGVRGPRAGEGVAGGGCQHRFRAGSVLVSPFSLGGGRRTRAGAGARGAGGRSPRAAPGQNGATPLHEAARNGRVEVAEKLLAAGAAVGATTNVRAPRAGEGVAGVFTIVICCQPLFRFLFSFCCCFSGGRREGGFRAASRGRGSRGARRGRGGGAPRAEGAGRGAEGAAGAGGRGLTRGRGRGRTARPRWTVR